MEPVRIGVIGGSGVYEMEGITHAEEIHVKTPFGDPSDAIVVGTLDGVRVAFLPRHGRGHFISPTELPARANIYALKMLGVRYVLSLSAVGSLREEFRPLDIVLPDQFIDLTKRRESTFFGQGAVAHVVENIGTCECSIRQGAEVAFLAVDSSGGVQIATNRGYPLAF